MTNTASTVRTAPIGIFDSGIGGLSVYLHLQAKLPYERFLYYADTANLPYGNKSSQHITELSNQAIDWLVKQGSKLVVVACNSASAHALDNLRAKYHHTPIVGLVPAIKPACFTTHTGKIAVLATQATLKGKLLQDVINEYATPQAICVYKHFEPRLVPWVESGMPIAHDVANSLIKQIHIWVNRHIDTLVLGCTHYPFFRPLLQHEINMHTLPITLIDSGMAIAERVAFLLQKHDLSTLNQISTHLTLYTTNSSTSHQTLAIAKRLIGQPITPFVTL